MIMKNDIIMIIIDYYREMKFLIIVIDIKLMRLNWYLKIKFLEKKEKKLILIK